MLNLSTLRLATAPLLTLLLVLYSSASQAQDHTLATRIDNAIYPLFNAGEPGATIIVTKAGQPVFMSVPHGYGWSIGKLRGMTMQSHKGFFIPNSVSYVEFERDAEGAVTQVTLHGAGEPVAHARIGALAQ